MLVECPDCHVHFSPLRGTCPQCHKFHVVLAECDEFVVNQVQLAIEDGASRDQVAEMLQDIGVQTERAADIIQSQFRQYKQGVRRRAVLRIVIGFLCVPIGTVFLLVGIYALWRGGLTEARLYAVAAGSCALVFGIVSLWLGGFRLFRGRD